MPPFPFAPTLPRLLRAVLPSQCLVCGESASGALCTPCALAYWPATDAVERCLQCGVRMLREGATGEDLRLFDADGAGGADGAAGAHEPRTRTVLPRRCGRCAIVRPAFDVTLALADYRPPLDIVVIALKFKRRHTVAAELAGRMAARLLAHADLVGRVIGPHALPEARPDVIVPVPSSARRLAARGYNQAWEIARLIARDVGAAAESSVLYRSHAAAQSGLTLAARRRNTRCAIDVAPLARVRMKGLHVGVVDDVMTTGATFDAVARALKHVGVRRVTNLVAFRTA